MTVMRDERRCALNSIDMWLQEVWHSTGEDRAEARAELRAAIFWFRTYFLIPERRRFAEAVARSKQHTKPKAA